MKIALVLCALFCASLAAPRWNLKPKHDTHWDMFKKKFNKIYEKDVEFIRRLIWEANLEKIENHNREYDMGKHTYTLGLNEYADMTNKEFRAHFLGFKMNATKSRQKSRLLGSTFLAPLNMKDLPDHVDWRKKGYVTPVKNQAQCGSCWAFSTTGSLEGQHFRKTGRLVSLSEQQLVDCSGNYGNNGCNGGLMDNAFKYIKDNNGIDTESSYPYQGFQNMDCKYDPTNKGASDTGFVDIPQGDEHRLQEAAANIGPISVAIDAGHESFQFYKNGVYDNPGCSSVNLDHGVLVVGYGTSSDGEYWLVKNSWGESWGEDGYIKMSRNRNNQCGIATQASYPLV